MLFYTGVIHLFFMISWSTSYTKIKRAFNLATDALFFYVKYFGDGICKNKLSKYTKFSPRRK